MPVLIFAILKVKSQFLNLFFIFTGNLGYQPYCYEPSIWIK